MVKYFRFRRLKCSAHNIFVFIVCWCIVLYSQGCVCFYPRFSRKRHLPVQKWQRLCRYGYSEVRNDTQKWGGFKGSNILFILFFWVLKYKIEAAEKKKWTTYVELLIYFVQHIKEDAQWFKWSMKMLKNLELGILC